MKKKITFIILILLVIGAFAVYKYLYKEHRDISTEEIAFAVPVETIYKEYQANDSLAAIKYADKTISVAGSVTSIDLPANTIIINERMSVTFHDSVDKMLQTGQQVKVKGRFVGYDDLLEELKMDHASIIN